MDAMRWSALAAGISAVAAVPSPSIAGPTGSRPMTMPMQQRPLSPLSREDRGMRVERSAPELSERRSVDIPASGESRPVLRAFPAFASPIARYNGFARFGSALSPWAAMCSNFSYAPPPLFAAADPFTRACVSPFATQETPERPQSLVPAHNKNALYGPGYHPQSEAYE